MNKQPAPSGDAGKGEAEMFFLERLKPEFSVDAAGLIGNAAFAAELSRLRESPASVQGFVPAVSGVDASAGRKPGPTGA